MPTNPTEQVEAVKLLSDDEVAEIERVIETSPCATFPMTTEEARALCATVRALSASLSKANGVVEEAAHTNTALREQLAESQSHLRERRETIKFWQRHIARMGKLLGTIAMDSEVEMAVKQLQSQLAQVTQERDDLLNRSHQTVLFECGCMFKQEGLDAEPMLIVHCPTKENYESPQP